MHTADTARATLLDLLPPGTTVLTNLHHVSRSGMSRDISLHVALIADDGTPYVRDITRLAAAVMGARLSTQRGPDAIRVGGAGMDMGFHLVYSLSRALYPDGYLCTGKRNGKDRCPSNDHNNDYSRLGREYDETHDWPGEDAPAESRHDYRQARHDWIASRRTHRKNRRHADGGYALTHRWL